MRATEEEAVLLIDPYLESRCKGHWCALEMEDRLAEARLVFLITWRMLPPDTGHFLLDFDDALDLHMKEVVRHQNPRTYSLDAVLGETGCNGHTFLAASAFDESRQYVRDFLDHLSQKDHSIVRALMDGYSKAEIARKVGISTYQLKKKLRQIGIKYLNEYREDLTYRRDA